MRPDHDGLGLDVDRVIAQHGRHGVKKGTLAVSSGTVAEKGALFGGRTGQAVSDRFLNVSNKFLIARKDVL